MALNGDDKSRECRLRIVLIVLGHNLPTGRLDAS